MRSLVEVALVRELFGAGLNNCEIARRTGNSTVRHWRVGDRRSSHRALAGCSRCGHPRHDFAELPARDYAYLLGLYLGDGCIARRPRGVFRLAISLDVRYRASSTNAPPRCGR